MVSVFEYLDYRKFLKEFYEESKKSNPYFSYRYIGKRLEVDPGYLVKVFQGKYHLTLEKTPLVRRLCGFSAKEEAYFSTLIQFNKAKNDQDVKVYFEKLLSYKEVGATSIVPNQYRFYTRWYYSAIRGLLGYYEFDGDYAKLGKMLSPCISAREAKEGVELLLELGFLEQDEAGVYRLRDANITTGEEWRSIAVREFQQETIALAGESLTRHDKKDRDISTLTVALSRGELDVVRDIIREFRSSVVQYVDSVESPDSVYQLNIQLIPMTEQGGK
ncbi:TIGR02147 family protein [Chitinivibrio alkaliphilus]|uniref:DUF4423 domain-containing protein n=1 Tax=Chitinivibrio alkaliphilus ACht1 TaxID=1313304 RepID=U7D8I2_9BACT|nr:TIGR02147 family protein [Chitinivibrio alkaliphilus]ERP31387.1 hypothetical protein CALK_1736 [Chitinivibrio alkaliphilus ACht1]